MFIVGASGAGKSSIIKLLLREKVPTKGTVLVNGYDLGKIKNNKNPGISPHLRGGVPGLSADPNLECV